MHARVRLQKSIRLSDVQTLWDPTDNVPTQYDDRFATLGARPRGERDQTAANRQPFRASSPDGDPQRGRSYTCHPSFLRAVGAEQMPTANVVACNDRLDVTDRVVSVAI